MTRTEHLLWSKNRAFEILDNGGSSVDAYTSFTSDMKKHPQTENHLGIDMGLMLVIAGKLNTPDEIRKFIEGFN